MYRTLLFAMLSTVMMLCAGCDEKISDADLLAGITASATQGDAAAQFMLGNIYAEGNLVGTDFEKASKWFRKSADQGHAQAQYALGIIFSGGRMGAVDVAEGYVWFCLAEKSGFAIAAEDCKILEDELSPEELAAAQTRMNELLAETLQVKD